MFNYCAPYTHLQNVRASLRIGPRLCKEKDVLAKYKLLQKKVQMLACMRIIWIQW